MTVSTPGVLPAFFSQTRRDQIDAALARYTRFDQHCPPHLAEAIRYSLLAPGKRLRPFLVLLAAEACGGTFEAAVPAACAVEMIHAYSLVHDDLPAMDDDDLRRGRPTCHKVYGEAVAILVGDALQARAFEILAQEVQPPAVAARCCATLAHAAGPSNLVGGQAADLLGGDTLSEGADGELENLEWIHQRKTGALIVASLELGGLVSEAMPEQLSTLRRFGKNIGLAFQITDDLLDVAGSQTSLGKRVHKDDEHGKLTYPKLFGVDESRRRAAKLTDEACAVISTLGDRAAPLRELARFICERNN